MNPDLERVIRLQELENETERARVAIADMPSRLETTDARVAERGAALATAKQRLADNQGVRRGLEKELAVVQGRLTKFKDQLMEVKTNREYQAMQNEIAVAEREVREFEDRILERMLEADEFAAAVKRAENEFAGEETAATEQRRALEKERVTLEQTLERSSQARMLLAAETAPQILAVFDGVSRTRKGAAVAEARNGHCTICHVRLRPQVFNDIRRNDSIIQCENCHGILYFAATTTQNDVQNGS